MNRSRIVKVRVTEAEYADWSRKALGASVSLSEAIRRAMRPRTHPWSEIRHKASGGVFLDTSQFLKSFTEEDPVIARCPHDRPHFVYCAKCTK